MPLGEDVAWGAGVAGVDGAVVAAVAGAAAGAVAATVASAPFFCSSYFASAAAASFSKAWRCADVRNPVVG
ncbi:MAG: hypothetical protein AB7U95_20735 [Reyranella sp.]